MKNIPLVYLLVFFKHTWFWLGIWVFYYLQFTNYAGIGFIEMVLILSMTVFEIPTGAIADMVGKKATLFLSFLLQAVGFLFFTTASSFQFLLIAVFLSAIGGTFYSGTIEALVYDSLKQEKKEKTYSRIIATMSSIQLFAPAVCGLLGGFLYTINPRLPFFSSMIGYAVGMVITLFLTEPVIDSVRFSYKNFKKQTREGFGQLVQSASVKRITFFLVIIASITLIADEMLNSFISVELGFSEKQLAILWSLIYLIASLVSQSTPMLIKKIGTVNTFVVAGGVIALTLFVSPWVGFAVGGFTLMLRSSMQSILNNVTSELLNSFTDSKYRATTLSTFNMIKNVPYIMVVVVVGIMADQLSARVLAGGLGLIMFLFVVLSFVFLRTRKNV